jgi:hypothetical protein
MVASVQKAKTLAMNPPETKSKVPLCTPRPDDYTVRAMHTLSRIFIIILTAFALCVPASALPKPPRPPVPKPKRPSNSHLLQKAAAGKASLLKSAANAGKSKLLLSKNAGKAALLRSAANAGKSKLLSARNSGKSALLLSKNAGKAALLKSAANSGKSKLLSALNAHKSALLSSKNAGKSALLKSAANAGKAKLLSALNGNKAALLLSKNAGKASLLKSASNAGKAKLLTAKNAGKSALLKSASNSGKSKLLSALNANKSKLLTSRNAGKAALLASARKSKHSRNSSLLLNASRRNHLPLARPNYASINGSHKLALVSRASAAAAHHHLQLQAQRAAHNFKSAQHNAGPNSKNSALLLQQQKNTYRFHQLAQRRVALAQENNIQVGSRGGYLALDSAPGIFVGNRMIARGYNKPGVVGVEEGNRQEHREMDDDEFPLLLEDPLNPPLPTEPEH